MIWKEKSRDFSLPKVSISFRQAQDSNTLNMTFNPNLVPGGVSFYIHFCDQIIKDFTLKLLEFNFWTSWLLGKIACSKGTGVNPIPGLQILFARFWSLF